MQSISFLGKTLDHPIMNAAGTCKRLEEVQKLAKSAVSAIMVGSITKEPREGNPGNVWEHLGSYSLNSLGLPNPGADYYRQNIPEMKKLAHDNGKLLFVSVAGFSPDEYAELAAMAVEAGADFIELNLGCPNVWGSGGQKPIASFDRDLIGKIIQSVFDKNLLEFGCKVSPYSNPLELAAAVEVFNWFKACVGFVTTCNTFPNAYGCHQDGRQLIAVGKGLAGFAGPAMKALGLGQAIQFRDLLDPMTEVIGVGGIGNGQDVCDYVMCRAKLVQVGSEFARTHNPNLFDGILQNYVDRAIALGLVNE